MNKATVAQQAKTAGSLPSIQGMLQRKCSCGSHTVGGGECEECAKNKGGLQRKLTIGASNDPLEQEADRVADQVMAASAHSAVSGEPPHIQRYSWQASDRSEAVPTSVDHVLASSGRPLEPELQRDMEQRFGHDFSRVRVHFGGAAEHSAKDVDANAYTVGHNIVFGAGRFEPGTHEGRRLIAHELTHVVQQSGRSGFPARRDAGEMLARQPSTTEAKTGVDPNIARARELSKKLRDGKRDDVLATIKGLAEKDREALEVAATQALDKPLADDLRRIIRFVRYKPPTGVTPQPFTVEKEGNLESKAGTVLGTGKKVEVRTGVSVKSKAGNSTEAYTLTYKGADAAEMHWLQFIWRDVVAEFPPKAKGGKPRLERLAMPLDHSGRKYGLTTDPARPSWNTDAGSRVSPFYEHDTTVNRSSGSLALADFPGSMAKDAQDIFKINVASPPTGVVSRFHADTYLVRNMDVLYRTQIEITWEFKSETDAPVMTVRAKGAPTDRIEAVQHARLAAQDPNVDFLPGPATDPLGEFFVIDDQAQWANPAAKDEDKYKDIIAIARAGWINDISGVKPSNGFNVAASKKDVKPGLNYLKTSGSEAGETGYIDAKGVYHNPDLPIDADTDPLPRIAVILTNNAFSRDKDWALETLRHELRHATHSQLTIGWLQKWREKGGGKLFKDWILAQKKAKKISKADYALVTTGLNLSGSGSNVDLAPTEVLAYTEGVITALPFLPPKPDLALIAFDKYPASIRGLKEGSPKFDAATAEPVREIALQQIHDSCCALGKCDALVAWIDFLLDPAAAKPKTATEKQTVSTVTNDFKSKGFIKKVLANVKKACK